MGKPVEKIWGTTEPLVVSPMFELHRLIIRPEHRCSFHVHRFKHNAFYVIEGELYIDMADGDLILPHQRAADGSDGFAWLRAGESLTIRPGVHHQFRTDLQWCTALEMYYTEPLSEDIVRRNVGGPV